MKPHNGNSTLIFTKIHCLNDGDTNAWCFCNIFSVIYGVNFPSFTRTCDVLENSNFFLRKSLQET